MAAIHLVNCCEKGNAAYVALEEYCIRPSLIFMKDSRMIIQFSDTKASTNGSVVMDYIDSLNLHCVHVSDVAGLIPVEILSSPGLMSD